jgi:hypothetical protein
MEFEGAMHGKYSVSSIRWSIRYCENYSYFGGWRVALRKFLRRKWWKFAAKLE